MYAPLPYNHIQAYIRVTAHCVYFGVSVYHPYYTM
mgnify:CR=1 FL=1